MKELMLISFSLTAAIFDLKYRRIPNKLVLGMIAGWLLLFAYELCVNTDTALSTLIDCMLGFALGGGIFLAVYLISRRGLGGGDVKFMAAAGLYLGLGSTIPAILLGTAAAALTGLGLILFRKMTRKDKLPLAPFLLAGIMITVAAQ